VIKPKVAVVGSGASGLAAALALINKGYFPTLIDPFDSPQNMNSTGPENFESSGKLAKKSKFGSYQMYAYPDELVSSGSQLDLPISLTIGGLTEVWGANIREVSVAEIGLSPENENQLKEAFFKLGNILPAFDITQDEASSSIRKINKQKNYQSKRMKSLLSQKGFKNSDLAVDLSLCIMCGECLKGCKYDAIFSAKPEWENLIESKKAELFRGLVVKIEIQPKKQPIKLFIENSGKVIVQEFDYVFLASGAIATAGILQRSNLIPKEVTLDDTQVVYLPLAKFEKKITSDPDFALSQVFYRTRLLGKDFHLSIYEYGEEVRDRIVSKHSFLGRKEFEKILSQILPGIGFFESDISQKLVLEFVNGVTRVHQLGTNRNALKRWLSLALLSAKFLKARILFPLIFAQMPNAGASYHVGNLKGFPSEKRIIDENGRIIGAGIPNLAIVDSAALQKVPVGPITFAVMANSYRIASCTNIESCE
jgi:ferredoxin